MVSGPREGETLEFRLRSTVRIGRVVLGNNIPLKDAGIFSKHLVILFELGKWSLQDLDSSNGTTLNSTILSPYKDVDLGMNETEEAKEVANKAKIETLEGEKIEKKEMDFGEKSKDAAKGNDAKKGEGSDTQASVSENLKKLKESPNLEKMSLEEWFDSIEVDLPKQILEVIEEMVEGMRRKVERVREYMIEQKKNQGVGVVG